MKLKSDISEMTITVQARQFAHILALATNYAEIRKHLKETEANLVRMRGELTNLNAKLERINAAKEYVTPKAVEDFVVGNPPFSEVVDELREAEIDAVKSNVADMVAHDSALESEVK